jgi:hypothetical protein
VVVLSLLLWVGGGGAAFEMSSTVVPNVSVTFRAPLVINACSSRVSRKWSLQE